MYYAFFGLLGLAATSHAAVASSNRGDSGIDPDALDVGRSCPKHLVIGVRGSDEHDAEGVKNRETAKMGETVAAYIMPNELPSDTEYLDLPYPAALSATLHGDLDAYWESESAGARLLRDTIRARIETCPYIKIALAGYSQGAQVVNDALGTLSADHLNNIRAVLLFADPKADSSQSYHELVLPLLGTPAEYYGNDGFFGPQALPNMVWDRATSICIDGDLVCNVADGIKDGLVQIMFNKVHTGYRQWWGGLGLRTRLGRQLVDRLKA